MKTKTIPFDLETAKKIQAGEIKGKIKTKGGFNVRIVAFDMDNESYQIVALIRDTVAKNQEYSLNYTKYGYRYNSTIRTLDDLILEVPDNGHQFKPFDKVLVRDTKKQVWLPRLFDSHVEQAGFWTQDGKSWKMCIPYEGNEHLLGTTNKQKED